MFKGSIPALVTPMHERLDRRGGISRLGRLADRARARTAWCRSARPARCPTLSHEEHQRVVEICIETAKGRVPVIAGAGSNNTEEAIELARHAEKAGADAVLVVTPYYNKPSQDGPLPALQRGRRRDRHSDHHLQHPAALGDRHDASRR